MFKTLRTEFKQLFTDFINCWKIHNKEREERVNKNLSLQIEVLKKYHSELEELKKFKSDITTVINFDTTTSIWCASFEDFKIKWIENCYFTKELISNKATNTKTLFVVSWEKIKKHFFKKWNENKNVKQINWKFYLFKK